MTSWAESGYYWASCVHSSPQLRRAEGHADLWLPVGAGLVHHCSGSPTPSAAPLELELLCDELELLCDLT